MQVVWHLNQIEALTFYWYTVFGGSLSVSAFSVGFGFGFHGNKPNCGFFGDGACAGWIDGASILSQSSPTFRFHLAISSAESSSRQPSTSANNSSRRISSPLARASIS